VAAQTSDRLALDEHRGRLARVTAYAEALMLASAPARLASAMANHGECTGEARQRDGNVRECTGEAHQRGGNAREWTGEAGQSAGEAGEHAGEGLLAR
jgi:hypothetical protein